MLLFGIATSAPLWWVLGVSVARRSDTLIDWARRYAFICIGWTAFNLVLFGTIAAIAS